MRSPSVRFLSGPEVLQLLWWLPGECVLFAEYFFECGVQQVDWMSAGCHGALLGRVRSLVF